ncbi:MAG: peptide-methionine (R)-S-oxide reductase, partial [Dyadobacter sp.]
MKIKIMMLVCGILAFGFQRSFAQTAGQKSPVYSHTDTSKVTTSESEWRKILPSEVFEVARLKGTERPGTSKFETSKEIGTYYCAVCGNALFKSDTK